jgi:methionyl-tRNA synthetase
MAEASELFLNCPPLTWDSIDTPLLNQSINAFQPLMVRVEKEKIQAMLEQSKQVHNGLN